jgi:hypothetical protein
MLAIGPDELGDEIEQFNCPHCGQVHEIEYGTSKTLLPGGTWSKPVPSKLLGFYRCEGQLYLASLNGRSIKGEGE